ncbi:putative ABC transporter ATP-binding protein/MT1014 [Leuconostoc suionicum]|uniref:ABC transporter ATP-binding protein/MT1014 n=2 Tax=Leuconostoc suionicum TaxID=1511761 RepID=A0A2N9K808_9LACO|nr:putative ABC transporter ATP-binding protein/MT1014 [Leuconostoc suionicum]SPE06708.1 putative ABC transporter ATP-binding protein/MT1014 [Leuconostoc suionicum]SPH03215.1 putative ABC transporter ATP-binding protein/MT1014 [Leuconostoc suionicum]
MQMTKEFIRLSNVSKIYNAHKENEVRANDDMSFSIKRGELTIIVGSSGAGKSTLLNTLGGMDSISEGEVWVNGNDISEYSEKQRTTYRRQEVGFVFQFYNLIPNLTALENVELANEIVNNPIDAKEAMESVGLDKRMNNFPPQMSGGEQQRVAVARAIAKNPSLLLADEPTGALDYHTGKKILKIFQDYVTNTGKNVIIVTHNSLIKPMADHVIEVVDGKIKSDVLNDHKIPVEDLEW